MAKKLQVFISSTFIDMHEERQAAVEAILRAGHIPAGMELFAAGNESQWETIKRWIDASDVYMLVLGGRYGTIKQGSGRSYVELEYNYAADSGKPLFAVVINEKALDEKVKRVGKDCLELFEPALLAAFRRQVTGLTSRFYDDTKDIRLAVLETLKDFEARFDMSGWVSGREVGDAIKLGGELARISAECDLLRQENTRLGTELRMARALGADPLAADRDALDAEQITIDITVKGTSVPLKRSCLKWLEFFGDTLILGVSNAYGVSEREGQLYYRLAPKLARHGLMEQVKVPINAKWGKMRLNDRGRSLLAQLAKARVQSMPEADGDQKNTNAEANPADPRVDAPPAEGTPKSTSPVRKRTPKA